jgi:N-acetylglucosamine-6-sulfatase
MNHETTRRDFLRRSAATAAASALSMSARHSSAQSGLAQGPRRNIIFILIDDQRYDAMGFMGHPFLETPRLDSLAGNGVVFDNAFVTNSLCSPSRASILTGTYAHRHGVLDNNTLLPRDLTTFPQLLQQNGYKTAFIGKWHMGGTSDAPQPGFDRWVSFRGQGVYNNPQLNIDGAAVKREGYTTDLLTDYAEDFLRGPHEKPFFLYLSHKAVHAEFAPASRHKGCYANAKYPRPASMADTEENYRGKPAWVRAQRKSWHGVDGMYNVTTDYDTFVRDYAETMRAVDDSVGRIVDTLRDRGLLNSTLILYTSDNGFLFGEHGLIDKRCMYEPSIRVPLIAHCPEWSPRPQRRKELVTNVDFAPTIFDAAGVSVPEFVQGQSFLKLLLGESVPWRDAFLYEYFWERSFPQTPTVLGVRAERYKFMKCHGVWDRYELYDVQNDPHEMNNLLGGFLQGKEGGLLDSYIRQKADLEVKRLFDDMQDRLSKLLRETGCRDEPTWTALKG